MGYAQAAITTFDQMLGTLDHLLSKAAESEKSDALLQARLTEDMHPLETQIRFTMDQAIVAINRLTGGGLSLDDAQIETIAAARDRVAAAKALVNSSDPAQWPPADTDTGFELPNGMAFALKAHEYMRDWAMPQFYFHLMAAYSILRAEGLAIGKADYVPYMMRHLKSPGGI